MKFHVLRSFALALVVAFGCSTNSVNTSVAGGGDDFPNSTTALAAALAQNTQLYSNWNQFNQVPDSQTTDLSSADSLIMTATATHSGLAKTAATQLQTDSVYWDLSDSSQGFVYLYMIREDIQTLTTEKRTIRYDSLARDSIIGNELVFAVAGTIQNKLTQAVLEYYLYDTDQNGFFDHAFIRYTQPVLGVYFQTSVWALSGNDNNFTVPRERRMYRILSLQISGGDTLQLTDLRDADGDSAIFRPGVANVVTATIMKRSLYPVLTGQPALSTVSLRAALPADDSAHWQMQTFHYTALYADGHSAVVTIAGNRADSLLEPNDSAYVLYQLLSAPGATYDSTSVRFSIKLGSSVNDNPKNALQGYAITQSNNHQIVRYTLYSFVSNVPIYPSTPSDSIGGTIHAQVRYYNGETAWATAVFGNGIFNVTYQTAQGDTVRFKSSIDGTVLQ
jgi:hypothetical protein